MRKSAARIPDRGDLVRLDAGRHIALVMSPASYNGLVGLALVCPVTSHAKGYPFEVQIPKGSKATGVILADQVKSLDWRAGNAEVFAKLPQGVVVRVQRLVHSLI